MTLLLIVVIGCGNESITGLKITISNIKSPAMVNSGEPNLNFNPDGGAVLSWIEKDSAKVSRLMFSIWQNSNWSKSQIISQGDNWFVNWADFPSVSMNANGVMLASWLVKSAKATYAYDIHISQSINSGKTWSESFIIHTDSTNSEHGFVAIAPRANNKIGVSWLDGRETVNEKGSMTLRYANVGNDNKLSDEVLLDSRVCDCCQTTMTVAGDGSTLVAYRNRSDNEVRDIYLVRNKDNRWSEPKAVANDNWLINGCPVNGPSISSSNQLVAVSWFTVGDNDSARVLCSFSNDFGETFSEPFSVDTGEPLGRVDIEFVNESIAIVSWLEYKGDTTRVAVRTINEYGIISQPVTVTQSSSSRLSGVPRMTKTKDGILITWTELSTPPTVKTALISVK